MTDEIRRRWVGGSVHVAADPDVRYSYPVAA
jgi:hypothetical protein